jgi:subtilisin-like proprotein convertase family protein
MKRILTILTMNLAAVGAWAQVYTTNSYSLTSSGTVAIPDGNLTGLMETFNVTGLGGDISNVQLTLDITGGFNGDLYAYLTGPGGQMAVLLNRTGLSSVNPTGYGDPGFNVTFDDTALNIHGYGGNGNQQLTGMWAPDGRNINPQSSGSAFDSASTSANLGLFNGLNGNNANGSWTLYVADVVGGDGTANLSLDNTFLTITTVPEPQTMALAIAGGFLLLAVRRRR